MIRTLFLGSMLLILGVLASDGDQDSPEITDNSSALSPDSTSESESEPKFSVENETKAEALQAAILNEAKSLEGHPWAGQYYFGDGLGVNVSLTLAPKNGCVFAWQGCMGLYDRNFGKVVEKDGRLLLQLEFANKQEGFQGIAEELIPVAWGERHYLIPADELIEFCNQVNEGAEPREWRHGMYLLKIGDEEKAVTGAPQVPEEYSKHLLTNAIESTIVAVGETAHREGIGGWRFSETSVTLSSGKASGLQVGMELHVVSPQHMLGSVVIAELGDDSCQGTFKSVMDEPMPQVGWRLSTRAPWYDVIRESKEP